jgi:uncharacterized protein with GYD domain
MPKYLYRIEYNREGLQGTIDEGFMAREAAAREMFSHSRVTFEVLYWTYGDEDLFAVADVPDDAVAVGTALALKLAGLGNVRMTPLLTAHEMDMAVSAMPTTYRPPGQ